MNKQDILDAVNNALNHKSNLDEDVLSINGMSSPKVRHLINNICSISGISHYLEVGTWRGSTLISAISNNKNIKMALGVDNFSQFVEPHPTTKAWLHCNHNTDNLFWKTSLHPKDELRRNIEFFAENDYNLGANISYIDGDCFGDKVHELLKDVAKLAKFDVYFYDGEHSKENQKRGVVEMAPYLSDKFILLVDDYNASDVRDGTIDALKQLNYKILYSQELYSRYNTDLDTWWNGIGVFLIEK